LDIKPKSSNIIIAVTTIAGVSFLIRAKTKKNTIQLTTPMPMIPITILSRAKFIDAVQELRHTVVNSSSNLENFIFDER
jgi:hypothetical protein